MKKIIKIILLLIILPINLCALTEAPIDITDKSIEEIQNYVDKGIINYETITRIFLERIKEYDDEYNTIITINENAIEEAKNLDKEYKKNGRSSLIYGIPILVKDNIDVFSMPTTAGTKALLDSFPKKNAKVVENLIKNGAIILGKTNMSEFSMSVSNSFSSFGYVKNAYNKEFTSYGSSGGSATAVSLGFSVLSLGTDTNSSIRVPASGAGLYGLRPSTGTLSREGVIKYDSLRDTVGIISKNISDSKIVLDVMEGGNGEKYLEKKDKKYKIGVLTQILDGDNTLIGNAFQKTDDDIKELFKNNLNYLLEEEIELVMIDDFFTTEIVNYENKTTNGWTLCNEFETYIQNTESDIKTFKELVNNNKKVYSLTGYLEECGREDNLEVEKKIIEKYQKYVKEIMEEYEVDALVYPTVKNKIYKYNKTGAIVSSYIISPATGLPSITYNMGYIDGIPYSMEFLSFNEMTLFNILDKLDNNYEKTKEVKNLYEIPIFVNELVNYYLNIDLKASYKYNKDALKLYNDTIYDVKMFFNNYNEIDDKDSRAKEILIKLQTAYNNLKNAKSNRNIYFVIVTITVFVIMIFLIKNMKYVLKKRKVKK